MARRERVEGGVDPGHPREHGGHARASVPRVQTVRFVICGHAVALPVAVEVPHVQLEGPFGRRAVRIVEADVAGDDVEVPITIEIGRGQGLPPSGQAGETCLGRRIAEARSVAQKQGGGHPLSRHQQVERAVSVQVGPQGVRHGLQARELRGHLGRLRP